MRTQAYLIIAFLALVYCDCSPFSTNMYNCLATPGCCFINELVQPRKSPMDPPDTPDNYEPYSGCFSGQTYTYTRVYEYGLSERAYMEKIHYPTPETLILASTLCSIESYYVMDNPSFDIIYNYCNCNPTQEEIDQGSGAELSYGSILNVGQIYQNSCETLIESGQTLSEKSALCKENTDCVFFAGTVNDNEVYNCSSVTNFNMWISNTYPNESVSKALESIGIDETSITVLNFCSLVLKLPHEARATDFKLTTCVDANVADPEDTSSAPVEQFDQCGFLTSNPEKCEFTSDCCSIIARNIDDPLLDVTKCLNRTNFIKKRFGQEATEANIESFLRSYGIFYRSINEYNFCDIYKTLFFDEDPEMHEYLLESCSCSAPENEENIDLMYEKNCITKLSSCGLMEGCAYMNVSMDSGTVNNKNLEYCFNLTSYINYHFPTQESMTEFLSKMGSNAGVINSFDWCEVLDGDFGKIVDFASLESCYAYRPLDGCYLDPNGALFTTDQIMLDVCLQKSDCCFISTTVSNGTYETRDNQCHSYEIWLSIFQTIFGLDIDELVEKYAPNITPPEWTMPKFCAIMKDLLDANQFTQTYFRLCECYGDNEITYPNKAIIGEDHQVEVITEEPPPEIHSFNTHKCNVMYDNRDNCLTDPDCCWYEQNLPDYEVSHTFCFNWQAYNFVYLNSSVNTTSQNICTSLVALTPDVNLCTCQALFSGLSALISLGLLLLIGIMFQSTIN